METYYDDSEEFDQRISRPRRKKDKRSVTRAVDPGPRQERSAGEEAALERLIELVAKQKSGQLNDPGVEIKLVI
jgi:hypothetical protein